MPEALAAPTFELVGDAEVHTLPNGATVVYRDRDHSYWLTAAANGDGTSKCSGRLTGVSTVVSPFDWRPDNLMSWAARLNCEGVAALAADGLSQEDVADMRAALRWLTTGESITSALESSRLHYTQIRDDAATRGTNVHKHGLHALAEGKPVPDFSALTAEEAGYVRGVMGFWHECEPDPLYAEQVVYDPTLGVAGRLDLVCELTYLGVRQRALVDAKTSGFLPTKHHVQLAGYEHCGQISGLGETDVRLILQVFPDGRYELVPATATTEDFSFAVEVYRRAARIGREANAARKAMAA